MSSIATVMGRVSWEVTETIKLNVGEPAERWQTLEEVDREAAKVGGGGSSLTVTSMKSVARCKGRDSGRSLPK